MNFAGSIPSAKTGFENFIFSTFNTNIDLSESNTLATVALVGIAYFAWQKLYNASKHYR